jgi:hypothetical protein
MVEALPEHSISENLETIRGWLRQTEGPGQRPSMMSNMRTVVFVLSPVAVIGFLGYYLTSGGQEENCICLDGGIRKGVSRQRLAF